MLKSLSMSRKLALLVVLAGGVGLVPGLLAAGRIGAVEAAAEAEAALADRLDAARSLALDMRIGAPAEAALATLRASAPDATDLARVNRLATLASDRGMGDGAALEAAEPLLDAVTQAAAAELAEARAERATLVSGASGLLMLALVLPLALLAVLGLVVWAGMLAPMRRAVRRLAQAAGAADRGDEARTLERVAALWSEARAGEAALRTDAAAEAERRSGETQDALETLRRRESEERHASQTLEDALKRLAAGDLTCRIEASLPERFAALPAAFNAAASHLHDTVAHVTASVASITNGTNEIGQAADDLSRRTEQQAASLDKTATALDEITATVKHSAENAASVASSVAAARLDTERSSEVMREAVSAMNSIQKSSQQIARIIGVIDEIAFQTNLLALNAGVEAARAGDAGRGFAVVALEVRALAQRSSEAAKEIKSLIGASSAQVGDGVDLVSRSGEVLMRIAAQVTQIDALVQEIAGSAREQSTGIAEVNDAVNKMDRVTQQNAAMVEETTAATLSLRTETEDLCRILASFHVSDTDRSVASLREMSAVMHAPAPVAAPAPRAPAPRPVAAAVPVAMAAATATAAAVAAPAPAADDLGWEEF